MYNFEEATFREATEGSGIVISILLFMPNGVSLLMLQVLFSPTFIWHSPFRIESYLMSVSPLVRPCDAAIDVWVSHVSRLLTIEKC